MARIVYNSSEIEKTRLIAGFPKGSNNAGNQKAYINYTTF